MSEERGRLANGGFGVCHLSAGKRGMCALGGIGCDQNHIVIKAMNEQAKADEATGHRMETVEDPLPPAETTDPVAAELRIPEPDQFVIRLPEET